MVEYDDHLYTFLQMDLLAIRLRNVSLALAEDHFPIRGEGIRCQGD